MTPYDAYTVSCYEPQPNPQNCPSPRGPDYDFAQGPSLFRVTIGGRTRDLIGAGQKSGVYWALDRDTGAVVWQTKVGPGSALGGMEWGSATDGKRIYVAVSNYAKRAWKLRGSGTDSGRQDLPRILERARCGNWRDFVADRRPQCRFPGHGRGDRGERRCFRRIDGGGRRRIPCSRLTLRPAKFLWRYASGGSVNGRRGGRGWRGLLGLRLSAMGGAATTSSTPSRYNDSVWSVTPSKEEDIVAQEIRLTRSNRYHVSRRCSF